MTPRQARLGVNLFALAVAASVGVALAGLTWRLLGDPGQRLGATPVAARPAPPPDISTLTGLSPFGSGAAIAGSADATVMLRGILLAQPRSASAALISVGGAAPVAFYQGSAVGGGTIAEIGEDHVVLAVGGERRLLAFPQIVNAQTAGAAAASPAPAIPTTVASGPTRAPAMPPPGASVPAPPPGGGASAQSILSGLGATPAADGFHVSSPSAQMRMAGVQAGDVLQRVNGQPIADLMTNPAGLQSAAAAGTARVDLMRNGTPLTLSIPLR